MQGGGGKVLTIIAQNVPAFKSINLVIDNSAASQSAVAMWDVGSNIGLLKITSTQKISWLFLS